MIHVIIILKSNVYKLNRAFFKGRTFRQSFVTILGNQSWSLTVAAAIAADVICNLEEQPAGLVIVPDSRIGTGNGMCVLNS